MALQIGFGIEYYDTVHRRLIASTVLIIGPYSYHADTTPCRFCHNTSVYVTSLRAMYLPPHVNRTAMRQASVGSSGDLTRWWNNEFPNLRQSGEIKHDWESLKTGEAG